LCFRNGGTMGHFKNKIPYYLSKTIK